MTKLVSTMDRTTGQELGRQFLGEADTYWQCVSMSRKPERETEKKGTILVAKKETSSQKREGRVSTPESLKAPASNDQG